MAEIVLRQSEVPDDLAEFFEAVSTADMGPKNTWVCAVEPTKIKHFACFPKELVRPIIRVATSAGGVCPKCGAPFARVIDKTTTSESGSGRAGPVPGFSTLGWWPTCTCRPKESVPAVVLDCFGGSGTTAQVAQEEGRDFILVDIDPRSQEFLAERLKPRPKKKKAARKRKKASK